MKAKEMMLLTKMLGQIMSQLDDIKQAIKDSVMENYELKEGEK
tara:strand:+ start:313 stop:441 length:129 start_codon:yes stop_codon:yes gene_type:complete